MCGQLNIRHTRTKPRHAWTNGFVERLQGTILHEHWRIAFRRRYFRTRSQLQASLDAFLHFYNFELPHQGYRTQGADTRRDLLGGRPRATSSGGLMCQHHSEIGHSRPPSSQSALIWQTEEDGTSPRSLQVAVSSTAQSATRLATAMLGSVYYG